MRPIRSGLIVCDGVEQGKLESLQQRQLDLQIELDLEMQKPLMPALVSGRAPLSVFTP